MITRLDPAGRHPAPADLVRFIDGEGDAADRRRWQSHLDACHRCAGEAEALRERSGLISEWLTRAAFEEGAAAGTARQPAASAGPGVARHRVAPPRMTPWLRAAAILLVVAAPLAAFPGVRAWVAERLGPEAGEPAVAVESVGDASPERIRFVPAHGAFTIDIATPREGGTLTLARAAGEEAILESPAGTIGEAIVSATRLAIQHPPGPGGSLSLRLPASVTGVVVRLGEREVRIGGPELDATAVVRLSGG